MKYENFGTDIRTQFRCNETSEKKKNMLHITKITL